MAGPTSIPTHVLIFPFPLQGHMNSMFKLSELLCLAGIHVTYLITVQNHTRLLKNTNSVSRFAKYPGFRFQMLPENVSHGNEQPVQLFLRLHECLKTVEPFLKNIMVGQEQTSWPVTCLITDGLMKFTLDVGEETGVPVIYFRTAGASSFWPYFCSDKILEAGDRPFKGDDMDFPVRSVPGMEGFLRKRDLPSPFRVSHDTSSLYKILSIETQHTVRARALLLNTFQELEGPIISQLCTKIPHVYTIGPLHAQLKARKDLETTSSIVSSSTSLTAEDKSCIKWLEDQPLESVIYVSFGSLATVTKEQLMEFWYGLVNSGHKFLWVIRLDSVVNNDDQKEVPIELEEGTKARGYTVNWAPQEEVLAHPAIGGFLTHSGWNSTLESIYAGVPMICWPYAVDQHINSRFVGEVWKLGLDIKDTCDRYIIEKAVRDLMGVRKEEFAKSAQEMATLARKAVSEGGDSHNNLNKLIEDIKMMNVAANHA